MPQTGQFFNGGRLFGLSDMLAFYVLLPALSLILVKSTTREIQPRRTEQHPMAEPGQTRPSRDVRDKSVVPPIAVVMLQCHERSLWPSRRGEFHPEPLTDPVS